MDQTKRVKHVFIGIVPRICGNAETTNAYKEVKFVMCIKWSTVEIILKKVLKCASHIPVLKTFGNAKMDYNVLKHHKYVMVWQIAKIKVMNSIVTGGHVCTAIGNALTKVNASATNMCVMEIHVSMVVKINLMNHGKYVKSGTALTTCGNVLITKHVFLIS